MPSALARIQNSRMNNVLSLLGQLPLDAFTGASARGAAFRVADLPQLRARHDRHLPTAGEPDYV
jgi:hypothetical protein